MGFKDWFKRNKDPTYFDQTSNINAIGVARVNDIKKLIKQIETKATKEYVDQNDAKTLNDSKVYTDQQIATIHPAPDLSVYARKDQANTFSENQTINGFLINNGLYKEGSDQQLAYIKNQGEKNIDILFEQQNAGFRNFCNLNIKHKYSNTNATTLFQIQTKNTNEGIFLACENNKFNFVSPTTITNVNTPTNDDHAANKQYVDNAIANIPTPPAIDLTQYAKKAEDNNFVNQSIKDNTPYLSFRHFADGSRYGYIGNETINNQNVVVNAEKADLELKATGRVICNKVPTNDSDIANKAYVDSRVTKLSSVTLDDNATISTRIRKGNVGSLYFYDVDFSTSLNMGTNWANKDVIVTATVIRIFSGGKDKSTECTVTRDYKFRTNSSGRLTINTSFYSILSGVDLYVGGSGYYNGYVNIRCIIMEG